MKAIQFNKNFIAEIVDVPIPKANGEKVIVKVEKCGICGSDVHMYEHGSDINHGVRPGHEFSGTVFDPGPRGDLKVGDRVLSNFLNPCGECPACKSGNISCCTQSSVGGLGLAAAVPGGMAEYVACFPDFVYRMPDEMDFDLGALTDPAAVALHAVNLGKVGIGSTVLVTGGGAIGLSAAILCKRAGAAKVIMTEIQPDKLTSIPKEFPEIDAVCDARDPALMQTLGQLSGGGFDVCVECSGSGSAMATGMYLTKVCGTVVLAGVSIEDVSLPTVMALIHELTIKGSMGYLEEDFVTCIKLLCDPQLNFNRLISRTVGMDKVDWAFGELLHHTVPDYKIMIDVNL
ncbi:MAG: alcohol dehydrogenase catalytic domain-containing protein [Oscillospiraceae bacterium]